MHTPKPPRYALVLWPDGLPDLPVVIDLLRVEKAVTKGAVVIAREDAILSEPLYQSPLDLTLLSGPRRRRARGDKA